MPPATKPDSTGQKFTQERSRQHAPIWRKETMVCRAIVKRHFLNGSALRGLFLPFAATLLFGSETFTKKPPFRFTAGAKTGILAGL